MISYSHMRRHNIILIEVFQVNLIIYVISSCVRTTITFLSDQNLISENLSYNSRNLNKPIPNGDDGSTMG